MTAMPQLVSLFNAVGGGAAALVAIDDYHPSSDATRSASRHDDLRRPRRRSSASVTFTGSLIASGKLQGLIPRQAHLRPRRPARHDPLALVAIARGDRRCSCWAPARRSTLDSESRRCPRSASSSSPASIFGVTMVLPIGGADMPVVISLLNSFTGTAAAMAGFVLEQPGPHHRRRPRRRRRARS